MILLELGGVAISVEESDSISQTYELIGGAASLRTLGGGLIRQRNWRRLKTVVSVAEARFLPALQSLDLDVTQVLKCVAPRERSFQAAARPRYDIWQARNSSRSSGVAMPLALKKSS